MKNLGNIVDQFSKDLREMGITGYAYIISDPDTNQMTWENGVDLLWQHGALDWLSRKNQLSVEPIEDEADDGENWKGGK